MKKMTIAALLAAQLLGAAQPAFAADLTNGSSQQIGAFAGARLRVPLNGDVRQRRIRAGFTLAPTLRTLAADGGSQLRFGEGLELGMTGREPVRLLLAGQDVRRLGAAQDNDGSRRHRGPSTLGWIAIGVGAAIVIVVGAAVLCASDHDCIPSE